MIPYVSVNGVVVNVEPKKIEETTFKVYDLKLDCFIPEIDSSVPAAKLPKANLQHYIPVTDTAACAVLDAAPQGKMCTFQMAVMTKLSGGRAKPRLIFREVKPHG